MTSSLRVRAVRDVPPRPDGRCVLYWMIGARRTTWNWALDRAVGWANELSVPLVVLEALRADYRWASDRIHRFVLDGMRDNRAACARAGVSYYPYLEPSAGAGRGLLEALAASASVVVTDWAPAFDLPRLVSAAASQMTCRFEAVDANGLLPLAAPPEALVFSSAYQFRRYLQRALPGHLETRPRTASLAPGEVPPLGPGLWLTDVERRWPAAGPGLLDGTVTLASLPIDHTVRAGPIAGGAIAAAHALRGFLDTGLARYGEHRNHPDDDAGSGLSPYLHFGHLSAHEVVHAVLAREGWTPDRLAPHAKGTREGWWGVSPDAEAFLDQVVTWRELSFNMSDKRNDAERFESLPPWAIATLERHASDPRAHVYSLEQFTAADTHDPLWNAAQRQLVGDGRLHNYLRMLWGKKILEWTASPREALAVMIELNNRYALDGRDPNSTSGIFWVLGRYDRPWAPERPIFGTVRYMSSANTARKLRVKEYLQRYSPPRLL